MHKTNAEAVEIVSKLNELIADVKGVEVIIGPPFTALSDVIKVAGKVKIAAQNMHWEEKGAFTGEISPIMLTDLGVDYVILGHSERRAYFGETNEIINKKIKSALAHGLKPILCVGEKLEDRENGNTENVVEDHVKGGLEGISKAEMTRIVIAYEPVWAIGTGRTATGSDAAAMAAAIRSACADLGWPDPARDLAVLYGGSVTSASIDEFLAEPAIDGALVGGASLKPDEMAGIVARAGLTARARQAAAP